LCLADVDEHSAGIRARDHNRAVRSASKRHARSRGADPGIGTTSPQERREFLTTTVARNSDWHRISLLLDYRATYRDILTKLHLETCINLLS
jgi:hypothetical protein